MMDWFQTASAFDIGIIVVLFFSIVVSFIRGFVREAISLLVLCLAVVCSVKFSKHIAVLLTPYIDSDPIRMAISIAGTFLVVLLLGAILNFFVKQIIKFSGLSFIDRLLGIVFGAARGVLIVTIVVLALQMTAMQTTQWYKASTLAPRFEVFAAWIAAYIPNEVKSISKWMDK